MTDTPVRPFPALGKRRTTALAYGFTLAIVLCTVIVVFYPSRYSSPWFHNILQSRSHFSSVLSHFFPQHPLSSSHLSSSLENTHHFSRSPNSSLQSNQRNDSGLNDTNSPTSQISGEKDRVLKDNKYIYTPPEFSRKPNSPSQFSGKNESGSEGSNNGSTSSNGDPKAKGRKENWLELMSDCNLFDGKWVKDDSYPLYAPGSCPHIDEPFNCFLNGRRDNDYQKYRWQPKNCNIPRLNGGHMLELLRGKRVVFVGDSLNRNMWESLVCILRHSVEDKSSVFEASGRQEFRTEGSYSFVFKDYNCSVEFFRSPFLVQEWEMTDTNGSKKETLRLDIVERSSDRYKSADVLVFNTGHWWTHEKTSKGKGYYQEGSHVYGELHVLEAFRKAMTTWARWVDANINASKTMVLFRGYSVSHFGGGRWNSGGQCDSENEPIKNDTYLIKYPSIMKVLESIMRGMKTPVFYLNITRISDYRKDAHPSIYRKQYLTEEERRSPLRYQDCSHWCLPGVPDMWNEIMYTQFLIRLNQLGRQQQ